MDLLRSCVLVSGFGLRRGKTFPRTLCGETIRLDHRHIPNRDVFFDNISQMKPEAWRPGTLDALATGSADGKRIVIKAVNYDEQRNTLLLRFQGTRAPAKAKVTAFSVSAGLTDEPTMADPARIKPVQTSLPYARDLAVEMKPFSV